MIFINLLRTCTIATALAGCQTTAEAPVRFDATAAAFIHQQGNARIDGHAFYRAETGRVIFAAGEHVWLVPVTAYSQARFAQLYGNSKYARAQFFPAASNDPDYAKYTRSTKAESNGRFSFERVAPGEYFVSTSVTWTPEGSVLQSGGAIYERVTVTGKEQGPIKVIVSGK
jgi:hypothetical protein